MPLDTKTELAELLFHSLGTTILSCTFPHHLDWEYPFETSDHPYYGSRCRSDQVHPGWTALRGHSTRRDVPGLHLVCSSSG